MASLNTGNVGRFDFRSGRKAGGKRTARRRHAVHNAVTALEKRMLFSSIATIEQTYGTTPQTGVTIGGPSDPPLVITTIITQPGTVVPVSGSGSSKTFSTTNGYTFLVNDGTGSAEVFRDAYAGYVPTVGDTVTINCKWSPFSDLPEFGSVTSVTKTGTAAVPATTLTNVITLNPSGTNTAYTSDPGIPSADYGYPLTLNATIGGIAGTTFTAASETGTITDNSGPGGTSAVMTIYTDTGASSAPSTGYSDLVGQPIPTGPVNITGFVEVFSTGGTYQPEFYPIAVGNPIVSGLSVSAGPLAGTNTITVSGYGFTTATAVNFGTQAATSFTLSNTNTDQVLTAVVPAVTSAQTVDVTVTNADGTSATSTADQYTYSVAPTITSISPAGGPTTGGTVVTISGGGLGSGDTVKFGTVSGTGVTYSAANGTLTATSPAEAAGIVDIVVSHGAASSPITVADQFTYAVTPSVSSLQLFDGATNLFGGPTNTVVPLAPGIDSGGNMVVINGANLSSATSVQFGTKSVAVTSANYNTTLGALIVPSPANSVGTVDVTVTDPAGTSAVTSADQFTYVQTTIAGTESPTLVASAVVTIDDNPVISQVLSIAGQSLVYNGTTIANFNYTSFYITDGTGSEDVFGAKDSSGNASLPGSYDPVVGNTILITATVAPYNQTPELGSVSAISTSGTSTAPTPLPTTIPTILANASQGTIPSSVDGYVVTLKGVDIGSTFAPAATTFGTTSLAGTLTDTAGISMNLYYSITYNEAALQTSGWLSGGNPTGGITGNLYGATIPTSNLVDVTGWVDINNGQPPEFNLISITNPSSVAPVLTSLSPNAGPTTGTNSVTINGYGFNGTTAVTFGTHPATNIQILSDDQITVTAPAGSLGTVNVTVTNENGPSNTLPYTYNTAPVVNSVVPGGDSTSGGPVVITGAGFTGATVVYFGTTAVSINGSNIPNDNTIDVTAPAHPAGIVDVTVKGANGVTSLPASTDQFIYDTIPTVTVTPASGPDRGGTAVTITGTSLYGTLAVNFGTVPATSFSYNSTTGALTAIAPAGTNGASVDVKVTNYAGTSSAAASDIYTYSPTTVGVAQNLASGVTVTIDSNPVITHILSQPGTLNGITYPYWAFLIQDSTGSIDIFQKAPLPGNFIPVVGNTISVTGVTAPFRQLPELGGSGANTITAIANTGTAPVPAIPSYTVGQVNGNTIPLGAGYAARLIQLNNVTVVSGAPTSAFGGTSENYGILNDSTGNILGFYYAGSYLDANELLYNTLPPTGPVTLDGFISVFQSGSTITPEFYPVGAPQPSWVGSGSQGIYNPAANTFYLNDASTITSDPGSVAPIIANVNTYATTTTLTIAPTSGHTVHIGGLNLTDGASVTIANSSGGTPTYVLDSNAGGFQVGPATTASGYVGGTIGVITVPPATLDLGNNILDIETGGASILSNVTQNISSGQIFSSAAQHDNTYLTTVGAILNTNASGGALYPTLGGATASASDVIVRYTYYGDANLDGKVDGSDYSLIDSSYLTESQTGNPISGWYNGDFNGDGVIDGSDYTLIDNAYNRQRSPLAKPAAEVASVTAPTAPVNISSSNADSFFSDKKVSSSLMDDVENLITN